MSVTLHVRLPLPIRLERLARLTEATLHELLAVPDVPRVQVEELFAGKRHRPSTDVLAREDDYFIIGLEGYEDEVNLGVIDIKGEESPEAYITVYRPEPLAMALAAALAIAIAREEKSAVVDGSDIWLSVAEQVPDVFAQTIAVQGSFADLRSAAEALYAKLPVGQPEHHPLTYFLTRQEGSVTTVDLLLSLPRPVPLAVLQPLVETALRDILAVPAVPRLRLAQVDTLHQRHWPPLTDTLDAREPRFVIGLEGRSEEITLIVTNREASRYWPVEYAGLWAEIAVTMEKTPLALALAASVALALARFGGSTIQDNWGAWSHIDDASADDFAHAIAVHGHFDDLSQAAKTMYAKLPVGQFAAVHGIP